VILVMKHHPTTKKIVMFKSEEEEENDLLHFAPRTSMRCIYDYPPTCFKYVSSVFNSLLSDAID